MASAGAGVGVPSVCVSNEASSPENEDVQGEPKAKAAKAAPSTSAENGTSVGNTICMVYLKTSGDTPSPPELADHILDRAQSAALIFVFELQPLRSTAITAARSVMAKSTAYTLLSEHRIETRHFDIVTSFLVRGSANSQAVLVGERELVARSPKRDNKVCVAQTVRLGADDAVLVLTGVNLDPHEHELTSQLHDLEQWLGGLSAVDAVLLVGDFNMRIARPVWAELIACDEQNGQQGVLSDDAVAKLVARLERPAGRRELAQQDPLSGSGQQDSPHAKKLRQMLSFDPLCERDDPGFPTYKRNPGLVPSANADLLQSVFFGSPPEKKEQKFSPQRYVSSRLGDEALMNIGWLDRAAWHLVPPDRRKNGGRVSLQLISHEAVEEAAATFGDHAVTVSLFRVEAAGTRTSTD